MAEMGTAGRGSPTIGRWNCMPPPRHRPTCWTCSSPGSPPTSRTALRRSPLAKPMSAPPPTLAELLAPHCGCADCESAVSPGAYLAPLLDYAVKHVRNGDEPLTAADFAERFHQPLGD